MTAAREICADAAVESWLFDGRRTVVYLHATATGTLTLDRPLGGGNGPALRTAVAAEAANAGSPLELEIEALAIAPDRPIVKATTTREPAAPEQRLPTTARTARAISAR